MIEKELKMISECGLHARPSSVIAAKLEKMSLNIAEMHYNGIKANLRSVMELLTIGIPHNKTALIILEGKDEEEALKVVEAVFATKEAGFKYE
jgi:phosphocarrier protein